MEEVLWKMVSKIYRFHNGMCSWYELLNNAETVRTMEQLQ